MLVSSGKIFAVFTSRMWRYCTLIGGPWWHSSCAWEKYTHELGLLVGAYRPSPGEKFLPRFRQTSQG